MEEISEFVRYINIKLCVEIAFLGSESVEYCSI